MYKLLRRKRFVGCLVCLLALVACVAPEATLDANILLAESFIPDQLAAWQLEGDNVARTLIDGERLIIEVNEANTVQFVTLSEPSFDNFSVTVDVRLLAGDLSSSYGILARMQGEQAFYRFEITGNGLYLIERHNPDGTTTYLIEDWRDSAAINQGIGVLNRLRVDAVNTTLSFYVNDILLEEVNDVRYTTGTIGLDAGTFVDDGLQVAFDNVVIKRPLAE